MGQGGRRGYFRGGCYTSGKAMAAAGPSRPNPSRRWLDVPDRGHGDHFSYRRLPFSSDEDFDRRYVKREVDNPYYYDDRAHGVRRQFYAVDRDPDYMVSSNSACSRTIMILQFHFMEVVNVYCAYPSCYGDDCSCGGGYYY